MSSDQQQQFRRKGLNDPSVHAGILKALKQTGDLSGTLASEVARLETAIAGRQPYLGVGNRDDLSLTYSNRQITIVGNADIWVEGVKQVFPGPYVFPQHPDVTGGYFFYFDENFQPVVTTVPWELEKHAVIAYVFYNASLGDGIAFYELHDAHRDPLIHYRLHFVDGTQVEEGSGFLASGFVLNSATDGDKTLGISGGRVWDEDIDFDITGVPDGGPYTIWNRTGASGDWVWQTVNQFNFLVSGLNIVYNEFTGSTWQLTALTGNPQFVNVWAFATTALEGIRQIFFVIGQTVFTDQATAEAESVGSINWGILPFQEIAPLYQLTYRRAQSNSGHGKADLRRVARLAGARSTVSQGGVSPTTAAAVSFVPYGSLMDTNVQSAIQTLEDTKISLGDLEVDGGSFDDTTPPALTLGVDGGSF